MARKWTLGLLLMWTGVVLIAAGLVASSAAAAPSAAATASVPANLIRLHVVANSDSDEDQALKRAVRDAILAEVTPLFEGAYSVDEARTAIAMAMPRIQQITEATIARAGFSYAVSAELGQAAFPGKAYGALYLPAGQYEALKVKIGAAGGANWWCVLFPPLCFVDWSTGVVLEPKPGSGGTETVAVPRDKVTTLVSEDQLQKVPVKARSAILEWVKARTAKPAKKNARTR